ncbi:DNA repair protein RadA [Rhodoluna limnophila]|uniref:DNA repair protein RadA n=1 Tax=Rhodoluna limnophila TaxID=232537 RepID=UPI0011068654|nr:DNA repair protein RadA [Rhodoluna limnophila]
MSAAKATFTCTECGWSTPKWVGRCGECQAWDTMQEGKPGGGRGLGTVRNVRAVAIVGSSAAKPITDVSTERVTAWSTQVGEFDRVLGGGLVPGAVVLLSGEPGVGKSTLLLEVAANTAKSGKRVLYVSGEESVGQIRLRAERTGAMSDNLFIASETDLSTVLGQIDAIAPELLVVDSVQTIAAAEIDGAAGMPSQIREVAANLIRVAKERALPVILVGHVTKDGNIAGPRALEHLVDVVCHFEGDRQTSLRFVRSMKNRFGPTDEVGCFEMTGEGIAEVADPSGLFLSRGDAPVSGTCVTVTVEGKRPLIAEVQALVVKSSTPQPRRVTNGVDSARVAMLLAVLERRAGLRVGDMDVYVSTVGGVRLTEPASDLAIALAIASAVQDKPIAHNLVAFGEISLAGEIRKVSNAKIRANEATRLGFIRSVDSGVGDLRAALSLGLNW